MKSKYAFFKNIKNKINGVTMRGFLAILLNYSFLMFLFMIENRILKKYFWDSTFSALKAKNEQNCVSLKVLKT